MIIKEVGAGIDSALAIQLDAMGAAFIDIAGLGGTNWTRIEVARYESKASDTREALFAPSLIGALIQNHHIAARDASHAKLIASGGLRHGLDVAKSLALGATMCCAAGPFLAALEDDKAALQINWQINR